MSSSHPHPDDLCQRLALLLRKPDIRAATAFANTHPQHHAITAPVSSTNLRPIHYACLLGDATLVSALLHSGAQVDVKALSIAASRGHHNALRQLLNCVPETVIQNAGEALFDAAYGGSIECVCSLVEAGVPSSYRGPDGSFPLHLAALTGSVAMVDCLLQAGANPTVVDGQGATAAMCAKRVGHRAVAGRLRAVMTELEEQREMGVMATTAEIRAKSKALASTFTKGILNKTTKQEDGCISSGDRTAGISPTLSDDSMEMEEDFLPGCWEEHLNRSAMYMSSMKVSQALNSNEMRFHN